ncbi:MAG: hypothetical protein II098_10500 [Treponema sp.]|nr:hypothetical protein [Treponema sp.]MEE1211053.1 hypothetical protein [Treponema sp.]
MVNGHSGATSWYAKGFPTGGSKGDKLSEHYNKHGKDMGFKSKSEYNNAAVDFMNKTPTASIDYFVDSHGTIYKFDHDTGEFGIADVKGNMITYFIPDGDAEVYWYKQVDKYDDEHQL